jgi:hypothetical protein
MKIQEAEITDFVFSDTGKISCYFDMHGGTYRIL